MDPVIDAAHAGRRSEAIDRTQALRELLRSRLETLGPVTAAELAAPLGVPVGDADIALVALEVEGQAMRGRFRSPSPGEEWCDRRLLARIHRYTLKSLRGAVEPVSPAAYMRFLFRWHQLGDTQATGPDALRAALSRLAGFPLPAAAWEDSILPARVRDYQPGALDQVLAGGEFLWARPVADGPGLPRQGEPRLVASRPGPIRTTPIVFLERRHMDTWQSLLPAATALAEASAAAARSPAVEQIHAVLKKQGAMFHADLLRLTGLTRNEVVQGLRELIASGLVSGDGYAGLRHLILPAARRREAEPGLWSDRPLHGRAGPGSVRHRPADADPPGRWSLVLPDANAAPTAAESGKARRAVVEHIALVLLERYGVVFRSVLQREARFLPPWRELAQAWRRLEARGEIRGGRFVAGFGGEQFAWPEAIDRLRAVRHAGNQDDQVILSAADPLNLTGIVTPGEKVPALLRNRVLYRNGIPVAAWLRGDFVWLGPVDAAVRAGLAERESSHA
jgi:ATP-dependent Lhr-like helicase